MTGDNLINDEHSTLIILTSDMIVKSFVRDYHAYKDLWKLLISEELTTAMVPDNAADKYAVCVKKNNFIVARLPLGNNGR